MAAGKQPTADYTCAIHACMLLFKSVHGPMLEKYLKPYGVQYAVFHAASGIPKPPDYDGLHYSKFTAGISLYSEQYQEANNLGQHLIRLYPSSAFGTALAYHERRPNLLICFVQVPEGGLSWT